MARFYLIFVGVSINSGIFSSIRFPTVGKLLVKLTLYHNGSFTLHGNGDWNRTGKENGNWEKCREWVRGVMGCTPILPRGLVLEGTLQQVFFLFPAPFPTLQCVQYSPFLFPVLSPVPFPFGANMPLVLAYRAHSKKLSNSGKLFTKAQNWQYRHYCQLCIPIYLPFCSSFLHFLHMMSVNVKLDISGCKSSKFQGCRLHWSDWLLMV